MSSPDTELPTFPLDNDSRCPFDPAADYAQWRSTDGLRRVNWQGHEAWVVSSYRDVTAALTDPRLSAVVPMQAVAAENHESMPRMFPRMNDPEHAVLRRMLTKDFTVKRVDAMRPGIEKLANELIDTMITAGDSTDLVEAYALPIPSAVISQLLGVPDSDHAFFQETTKVMMTRNAEEDGLAAQGRMFGYLYELIGRKERDPDDSLISRLIREHLTTGELDRQTIAMNSFILLTAGHETTANMIALGTLALLENPGIAARIRDSDDPKIVSAAVEDLLRYLTVVRDVVARVATEDVEIGGTVVRAGDVVVMNLPAANRDTALLPDPDTLDPDHATRAHVAFGHGVHQCLGQTLARAELEIALPVLLRRLPNLRLAVPLQQLHFRNDMVVYGVHELPVTW
jgi:cytochrome P450